jgi:hypothetical protein
MLAGLRAQAADRLSNVTDATLNRSRMVEAAWREKNKPHAKARGRNERSNEKMKLDEDQVKQPIR